MSLNKKYTFYLSFFLFLFSFVTFSQNLESKELKNGVRINFIPVEMPTDKFTNLEPTMGLAGLHYLVPFNDWLYGGAAFYMATTGDQGGLFTLGVDLGISKKIYQNLYFDANFHFGGGGGYRSLIKDGGFINPNIGLQYKTDKFSFGIQYSHVNFYSGFIKDNAISFFIEIPSILRITDYEKANDILVKNELYNSDFIKKPAVKNVQQVRFDFFNPIGKSKKDNGDDLTETLYVLGFEYQKYLTKNTFLFAHTDAIYKGLRAGFMDVFIGAGYHPYQTKYINIFTKLAIGAAGGRVAPEGGLMMYPSAGIDVKISDNISLSGHSGYYRALDGDLEAITYGFGVKYLGLNGGTKSSSTKISSYKLQGIRVEIQNQSYFGIQKTDDYENKLSVDLQLIGFKINYDINDSFYITGETGFAYEGRSGGYAHGIVGAGYYTPKFLNHKGRVFIETSIGAAGGAGVDTGEGIVMRPTLGILYDLNKQFSFIASGGKLISPFGGVNSTNINIGLSFNFSTLSLKQ